MYFSSPEELARIVPVRGGVWNDEYLREYLIWSCNRRFRAYVDRFLDGYPGDEALAELLFSFLLNDDYDGSDCQMGAARLIARMDRQVLRAKEDLLRKAQSSPVRWKRPFPDAEDPDGLL